MIIIYKANLFNTQKYPYNFNMIMSIHHHLPLISGITTSENNFILTNYCILRYYIKIIILNLQIIWDSIQLENNLQLTKLI